jgi:hypothetical protein
MELDILFKKKGGGGSSAYLSSTKMVMVLVLKYLVVSLKVGISDYMLHYRQSKHRFVKQCLKYNVIMF